MDGSTFDVRSGTGMKPLPAASGDAGRVVVELDPNIVEKTGFEGIPTQASESVASISNTKAKTENLIAECNAILSTNEG
ncbi:hypothetical protein NC651_006551 [Populus alba x Populus x berolinensis]|nr:hypothetical protein NC651_006551 [Populus alba x Populus x berolinensis]